MNRLFLCFSPLRWRAGFALLFWCMIVVIALFAPWLSPHDPNAQNLNASLIPPVWITGGDSRFPLGTTVLGECILSRLIYGTRITVLIALGAAGGSALLGTALGILAGYKGGWVEKCILMLIEFWMSFPAVVLALLIVVVLSPGITSVIIALILVDWTRFCRVMHTEVVQLKHLEFIKVARILGASHGSIIVRDILPHLMPAMVMLFSIEMAISALVESTLSFVGISVATNQPSWGAMIAQGLEYAYSSPWQLLLPALSIIGFVLICTLFSDGINQRTREH